MNKAMRFLVPCIVLLTLAATVGGLLPGDGTPFEAVSVRGEKVLINARGLYFWDTVSSAAQMQANDLITLFLALPLLLVSFFLVVRGSLRGKMVLAGILGFILYTYTTMCFGAHFNALFSIYVALFSASLFSLILTLMSFDVKSLPGFFSAKLPRGLISALLFFAAAFIVLAWSGRISAAYASPSAPVLENTTSMFIQAMDLGIIAPLCVVSGVLLLRGHPWGYLLAPVSMIKFATLGIAVSLMAVNMARRGVAVSPVEMIVFPVLALSGIVSVIIFLVCTVSPKGPGIPD